jgi:uncharacterized repeat protein (TIGR01451 family)
VTVTNHGPDIASNVIISSLQLDGLTFVRAVAPLGTYSGDNNGTWTIPSLAVGQSITLTIDVRVDPGTAGRSISNCAALMIVSPPDSNSTNNSGCVMLTVESAAAPTGPDLAILKTVDLSQVSGGETMRYTLVVSNRGPGGATGVSVLDRLPFGVTFVSSSATHGQYDAATAAWQIGTLSAGATARLTIEVLAATGSGAITNCATIPGDDAEASNNTSCATTQRSGGGAACDNRPPVLSVPLLQNIEVGSTLVFRVAAIDPDGDTVGLFATALPSMATFDENTGELRFAPSDLCDGEDLVYTPVFAAVDSRGAVTSAPVRITVVRRYVTRDRIVSPRNASADATRRQPVISIPPQPFSDGTGRFMVTARSQEQDCAVDLQLATKGAGAFDRTTGVFTYAQQGLRSMDVVQFAATDCKGRRSTASVAMHSRPAARAGLIAVESVEFVASRVRSNSESTIVSLTNGGSSRLTIAEAGFVDGESFRVEGLHALPIALAPGCSVELRVMFEPAREGTISDRLVITTDDPAHRTTEVGVSGEGIRSTSIATVDSIRSAEQVIAAMGTLPIGPNASGALRDASCGNREPLLSVPTLLTVELGTTLRFAVSAADPDGDPLRLGVSELPAGASFDASRGEFVFTPSALCGDVVDPMYAVTFVAIDERGASSSAAVQITVVEKAGPDREEPIISAPLQTLVVTAGSTVRFPVRAMSTACEASVKMAGADGVFDAAKGEYVVTIAPSTDSGTMLIPFVATGCNGISSKRAVRIEVRGSNETRAARLLPITKLAFPQTEVGSTSGYVVMPVSNMTSTPVTIHDVTTSSNSAIRLDGVLGLPVVLQPGQELSIRVAIQPVAAGAIAETMIIRTTAGVVEVAVTGLAQ